MLDAIIRRDHLLALVDQLGRSRRLIGPVARDDAFFYREVAKASEIDLAFTFCVFSVRGFLFPPTETLFSFNRNNGHFYAAPVFDESPTAFVGVHPCDINAIRLLDQVFTRDARDEHYMARRENTMIIGMDCLAPCTSGVFCADMKGNEAAEGFDVMLYPLRGPADDRYGVIYGSDAGCRWIQSDNQTVLPTAEDEREFKRYMRLKEDNFPAALRTPAAELPRLLDRSYDSLLWEATARRCYSCGSCNLSCPTCYCFNIYDDTDLSLARGERKREWDGCQLKEFALVAGNHNFRPLAASRLRHRIYRKAKWVRERLGLSGCVGCARCDRACTARISSVEIYNQLAEEVASSPASKW